jgi:hypothetical protein
MSVVEFFSITNLECEIDELRGGRWSVGVLWCPRGNTWEPEARFKREEKRLAVPLSLNELLTETFNEERFRSIAAAVGANSRDRQENGNVLASMLGTTVSSDRSQPARIQRVRPAAHAELQVEWPDPSRPYPSSCSGSRPGSCSGASTVETGRSCRPGTSVAWQRTEAATAEQSSSEPARTCVRFFMFAHVHVHVMEI